MTDAPWHVEVLQSQLKYIEGPGETNLKRLEKATKCQFEIDRPRKKKGLKAISYGGQTQYLDDDAIDESNVKVKIFLRGSAERRAAAAELISNVADGDDFELHCARAEGAVIFSHDIVHPDFLAWARWRLLLVAHDLGARAHIGKNTVCVSAKLGGSMDADLAEKVQAAAEAVIEQAGKLVELVVDGKDELEPEDAGTDPAVAPFIDQYGVIVRVIDQDDNNVSDIIKIRVVGPTEAANDVATLLRARFVDGTATATVLQGRGQVQAMPGGTATDFSNDLNELANGLDVKVQKTQTMLWICGPNTAAVAEAKKTLQEMLQFYIGPSACHLVQDLKPAVMESLLQDEDIGGFMTKSDCVVEFDEAARTAWMCGANMGVVKARIEELTRLSNGAAALADGEPAIKKRRTSALTSQSISE